MLRGARRARVVLPASMETVGTRRRVALIDISQTGAKLEGEGVPAKGETIMLKVGPVDALATVVWAGAKSCGITFDRPIAADAVDYLNGEGGAAARAGLTIEEKQAHDDWANGLTR